MESGSAGEDRYTAARYFALVGEGLLAPDERVELLDGIIVAMPPQAPPHASGVRRVDRALRRALGSETVISSQLPLIAGTLVIRAADLLPSG